MDPSYARQGIGRQLVIFADQHIIKCPVSIEVLAGNTPALALYQSCGFQIVKTLSGRMPGNESFSVTVHVLEKHRL